MRFLSFLGCLSGLLLFAGCSTPPDRRLDPPPIQLTELTAKGDTYSLTLRFTNTNTVPLVINRATHALTLGTENLGKIDDRTMVGIPPLVSGQQTVVLSPELSQKIRAYFAKNPGSAQASIESTLVIVLWGDETFKLKTSGSGSLKAP